MTFRPHQIYPGGPECPCPGSRSVYHRWFEEGRTRGLHEAAISADRASLTHGHLDQEANPSDESNVTIHGHVGGDKPHRHPNAPAWGAIGSRYVSPERADRILARES